MELVTIILISVILFLGLLYLIVVLKQTYNDAVNFYNNNFNIVLIASILTLIAFMGLLIWNYSGESGGNKDDILNSVENNFKLDNIILDDEDKGDKQINYDDSLPSEMVSIKSVEELEDLNVINWEKFKSCVEEENFCKKFHESILESCKIKKKRYTELARDLSKEAPAFAGFNLNGIQTPEEHLGEVIKEINKILGILDKFANTITVSEVKLRLKAIIKEGETLVGRKNIKDMIAQRLYVFGQKPKIFSNHFQNMILMGASGIGKTKLAQTISKIFVLSGILVRSNFLKKSGTDFGTAYVKESGKLTKKILMKGLEGIVFIDEAYSIAPDYRAIVQHNHGMEAIDEMVNHLEVTKGLSFVIAAGYEKDMKNRFLSCNEGMPRRFPHKLVLDNYTADELFRIALRFLQTDNIYLNVEAKKYLWGIIDYISKNKPHLFKRQAGDILNLTALIAHYSQTSLDGDLDVNYRRIISTAIKEFTSSQGDTLNLIDKK